MVSECSRMFDRYCFVPKFWNFQNSHANVGHRPLSKLYRMLLFIFRVLPCVVRVFPMQSPNKPIFSFLFREHSGITRNCAVTGLGVLILMTGVSLMMTKRLKKMTNKYRLLDLEEPLKWCLGWTCNIIYM